ncbi:KIR-like protein [Plasmodium coatneyi]|uniref:KIR-like protein n=1 Tax=Plasmodium coatneyi TaxID=208452 RepID=A0A1B1E680_9APIC|nr:KIR-like protein [Plasmodium coatneyi]ANQ10460.1 KIR-like protein [Plasmodium coatneyi]
MSTSTNPLNEEDLPAHVYFYGPLGRSNVRDCEDESENSITSKLTKCCNNAIANIIHKIQGAYCFVSNMKPYEGYPHYKDRWHFLYYWVGEQIWNELKSATEGSDKFAGCLKSVCDVIKDKCTTESDNGRGGQECKLNCPQQMDGTTFAQDKKVFDFSSNYNEIRDYVYGGSRDCGQYWPNYKGDILKACTKVTTYCEKEDGKTKDKQYCEDFPTEHGVYCRVTLKGMNCKPHVPQPKDDDTACTFQDPNIEALKENVRSATTKASISSILGTLGLTVVPYVLYKYKPWSSWFGNHTSGNGRSGRNRKKRTIGRNFDVSAEETFTEYSTDNSTIGDSTTDNSTTLRSPTAYTRRSTTGPSTGQATRNRRAGAGTNNHNTPGHHRNNVGYSRM